MKLANCVSLSRRTGLVDYVVNHLRSSIAQKTLASGEKLPTEGDLMAELKVSRSVVREAISRMQAAGEIITKHGIGSFVSTGRDDRVSISFEEWHRTLSEIFELRRKIEQLETVVVELKHEVAN